MPHHLRSYREAICGRRPLAAAAVEASAAAAVEAEAAAVEAEAAVAAVRCFTW